MVNCYLISYEEGQNCFFAALTTQVQLSAARDQDGGGLPKDVRHTKTRRKPKNIIKPIAPAVNCNGWLGWLICDLRTDCGLLYALDRIKILIALLRF